MERFKKRWCNLTWYDKVAATPGIILFGCLAIITSPLILLIYCGASTAEALGVEVDDDGGL